jgi:hypothetical protein
MSLTFYSVPIPKPATIAQHKQIAFISTWFNAIVLAYWCKETEQILLLTERGWFIQPDATIKESLTALINITPEDIKIDNLWFIKNGSLAVASNMEAWQVYDQKWSDFFNMGVCAHFKLESRKPATNELPSLSRKLSPPFMPSIYEEEYEEIINI